jgi:hypothetical protein
MERNVIWCAVGLAIGDDCAAPVGLMTPPHIDDVTDVERMEIGDIGDIVHGSSLEALHEGNECRVDPLCTVERDAAREVVCDVGLDVRQANDTCRRSAAWALDRARCHDVTSRNTRSAAGWAYFEMYIRAPYFI